MQPTKKTLQDYGIPVGAVPMFGISTHSTPTVAQFNDALEQMGAAFTVAVERIAAEMQEQAKAALPCRMPSNRSRTPPVP